LVFSLHPGADDADHLQGSGNAETASCENLNVAHPRCVHEMLIKKADRQLGIAVLSLAAGASLMLMMRSIAYMKLVSTKKGQQDAI